MGLIATISASGDDATLKLLVNSEPLTSRIASELAQRGLVQLSSEIDRGLSGLSTYSFRYTAEIGNTDGRAWSDEFLRTMIAAAIQAATSYSASVSIVSRPLSQQGNTDPYNLGGGVIPGGKSAGGDPSQKSPDSLHIPIVSDLIDGVQGLTKGLSFTGQVALIAVGVLVVGGVVLVLTKPETVGRAIRG